MVTNEEMVEFGKGLVWNQMTIDINAIREALPHRYPMLWWIAYWKQAKIRIVAIKNVTINEPFLMDIFYKYPVGLGVLIMKLWHKTAGVLELTNPKIKRKHLLCRDGQGEV